MTDHPSPEQEAARIAGELESITEACPSNPCLRSCNLCPDCLTKLEEAIAAALAAKEADITRLTAERDTAQRQRDEARALVHACDDAACGLETADFMRSFPAVHRVDDLHYALTQAHARVAQLEQRLAEVVSLFDGRCPWDTGTTFTAARQALRATSPEEP